MIFPRKAPQLQVVEIFAVQPVLHSRLDHFAVSVPAHNQIGPSFIGSNQNEKKKKMKETKIDVIDVACRLRARVSDNMERDAQLKTFD